MTDERPVWDEGRARAMIGARVVIGLTRRGPDGNAYEQMFGTITSTDARSGFEVELAGARAGTTYWLPPQIDTFQPAEPGEYRLRATGETVVNPDYLAMWKVDVSET